MDAIAPQDSPGAVGLAVASPTTQADEWETQQVVVRFTAHFDAVEGDRMEQYFAPAAVWYQPRGPVRGRAELRERMAAFPRDVTMRHVITNLRTSFLGPDDALVESYFTLYKGTRVQSGEEAVITHGPKNVGRYHDRLRRIDGRWLLDERRVTFDFSLPDAPEGH